MKFSGPPATENKARFELISIKIWTVIQVDWMSLSDNTVLRISSVRLQSGRFDWMFACFYAMHVISEDNPNQLK